MQNTDAYLNAAGLEPDGSKPILPAVLRPKQGAAYLNIGIATFWRLAKHDPTFPPVFKMSDNASAVMREELDAWLAAKREVSA